MQNNFRNVLFKKTQVSGRGKYMSVLIVTAKAPMAVMASRGGGTRWDRHRMVIATAIQIYFIGLLIYTSSVKGFVIP